MASEAAGDDINVTSTSLPSSHRRSNSDLPPFFFPGPSSKFNTTHNRTSSPHTSLFQRTYTPTSPVLSTAQRAQSRRVQSNTNVPTLTRRSPSSPLERFARQSPLSRSFSNYTPPKMSNTHFPTTPAAKNRPHSRADSKLQDSPFSDYFTDDGRSPTPNHSINNLASESHVSPETQQLLVRLHRLQAQLMRGERETERTTLDLVGRKIGEIEGELTSVHAQTRLPPEMEDSGLFLEDDEDEDVEDVMVGKVQNEGLLLEAQRALENVTKANELLRKRYAELKQIYESHSAEEASARQEVEALRSENEALKSDLENDNAELLFLRLEFKGLQVEVQASDEAAERLEKYAPEIRDDIQKAKRQRVSEGMQKLEGDWEDVSKRMRGRRRKYPGLGIDGAEIDINVKEDGSEWELEMMRDEENGKVQSVAISRLDKDEQSSGSEIHGTEEENAAGSHQLTVSTLFSTVETAPEDVELGTKQQQQQQQKLVFEQRGTQTDLSPIESWLLLPENEESGDAALYEDCAITTSSEDNDLSEDEDTARQTGGVTPTIKLAWQELWAGLSDLAGMSRED